MVQKKNSWPKNHHTILFKKILSSFFSKESMLQMGMNPASMFVSFISSRQFFWLINRRMTEHYKLNLLDINLDSFDIKIGFGDDPTVTVKNIDIYYAYNSSANFVGYKSYSPNIIATGLSMFFASQTVKIFDDEIDIYFTNFIYTIYFLSFLFIAHIKVFPEASQQEQFDRFVTLFRSFYEFIFENTKQKLDPKALQRIKILFTDDLKTMFSLFHSMKELNSYFTVAQTDHKEFVSWLLAWELHHKTHGNTAKKYLELYDTLSQTTVLSSLEKEIIDLIVPADIIIKYLFGDGEWKMVAKHILSSIYPPEDYQDLLKNFIYHGEKAKDIIEISTNFTALKKNFFFWLQNYIKAKIHNITQSSEIAPVIWENFEESIDEFLSYLSDSDQIDLTALPKNIQVQSITFDKLINFYISFVGGLWIARGDSGALRVQQPWLLGSLIKRYPLFGSTPDTIQFYSDYFRYYEKNVFYYQYIFNHVRSGKESFILPTQASVVPHDYNIFVIQLLHESYRSILLQDANHSDIKLFIKKAEILTIFKDFFGESISSLLKLSPDDLIQELFSYLDITKDDTTLIPLLQQSLGESHISNIKDRMYCVDFRLYRTFIDALVERNIEKHFDAPLLVMFYATLKETLFGFLLFMQYVRSCEESHQKDYKSSVLISLYCQHILHATIWSQIIISELISETLTHYTEILSLWILFDDNQDYMYIGFNSWNSWIEHHHITDIITKLSDEDIVWFRWFLKHISYYNKRFLIPNA